MIQIQIRVFYLPLCAISFDTLTLINAIILVYLENKLMCMLIGSKRQRQILFVNK